MSGWTPSEVKAYLGMMLNKEYVTLAQLETDLAANGLSLTGLDQRIKRLTLTAGGGTTRGLDITKPLELRVIAGEQIPDR